jgi:hypothetical protein
MFTMNKKAGLQQNELPAARAVSTDHLRMIRVERLVSLIIFLIFTALILLY